MHIRAFLACSVLLSMLIPGHGGPARVTIPAAFAQPGPAPSKAVKPKLVVLVIVDQLPGKWFEARRKHFPHGLAGLIRKGVYYPEAAYPYAVTFTAAGHAALGTGAPPAVTGVADNERYHPDFDEELPAADDGTSPVFVLAGHPIRTRKLPGRSSAALLVDGVADILERDTQGRARTVTISIKDRSAIFVGGRKPDLAIWLDESQPAMTTSAHYVTAAPDWLRTLAQQNQVEKHKKYVWNPLNGLKHRAITGINDRAAGETVQADGLRNAFPHRLAASQQWAKDLQATPAADLLVFETARAAIAGEHLGEDEVPDFLALSFSAPDMAGHNWGPDSWERLDILARFDQELAGFLKELDENFGQRYALVLTSDHGITPLVEHTLERGGTAYRHERKDLKSMAEDVVDGLLGQGKGAWIAHVSDNSVFISPELRVHPRRAQALAMLVQSLRALPGIRFAEETEGLRGNCEARPELARLACYSIVPKDPGEIYFAAAPKSIITKYPQGTNHGSPNPDDRIVPIVVHAPGDPRWAKPRIVRKQVNTLQVAPTLAALLGIPAPPAATQPPLP
jgi:hypothetical protein